MRKMEWEGTEKAVRRREKNERGRKGNKEKEAGGEKIAWSKGKY